MKDDPNAGYGDYAICFDNTFSVQSKKTVFFEYFLLDERGDYLSGFDKRLENVQHANFEVLIR